MNPKLEKLKKEAPEEIPLYMKAGELLQSIKGISIYGDNKTLEMII